VTQISQTASVQPRILGQLDTNHKL